MTTPSLLREDPDWLWLDKPAGVPVFPPHADLQGPCVLRWLLETRPEQAQPFPEGFAGGLAHRLDVSTSGLVLAARSPEALARARAAFAEGRLAKRYRFVTAKAVPWTAHHLTTPLAHHKRRRDRMVPQRGRSTPHRGRWYPADTRLQQVEGALWEAVITTGVMHQIRVHAASAGLALWGDPVYGGGALPEGVAPEGVRFALHHVGWTGLGDPPQTSPPLWWGDLLRRAP
ncbi:MAG: RNA pseudouridine synthase [Alphaproteobacteria bacterium]|nr:RNA pseudouridine synthase [Alphaproteobacteria bacterium]